MIIIVIVNQPQPPKLFASKLGIPTLEENGDRFGQRGVDGSGGPGGIPIDGTMPPPTAMPTTASFRQQNLNEFCRFRDDGPHALPTICDVFIYCVHGIGSFETCKNGTKFNPEVLGCDHAVNYECAFSGIDCK